MHDYYARYLPQMALAVFVPLMIVIAIFPFNWVAALILLGTAPLIPLFMAMVGMGAADANRRNFLGAGSVERSFPRTVCAEWKPCGSSVVVKRKPKTFAPASQDFRQRTMEVLRMAFLSSGVLEFFTSLSIALVAVYFGFSYLGALDFGHYGTAVTLSAGFLGADPGPGIFPAASRSRHLLPCQSAGGGCCRQPENLHGNAAGASGAW